MSPADLADLRRQNTNSKTTITAIISQPSPTCLSLRNNAACCIPLRNLRYLRENNHARVLKQFAQTKPQCLPQISQIYADKPQNNIKQTVFLCDIMQPCCIPLRDLRYLRENIHIRVLNLSAQRNPNVSRRFRRFTQTNHKTTKQH